ncbi:mast cell protease 1A-like [Terrapene carolina triunguis]|uniref:mast cell protease 1A-like n=1 Tax=Terrapene triunguis TaxID=2587831 RepID=UPI000E77BD33|nr:mast cell protease 1A-like [Terrapene carolina triunguis]
MQVQILLLLPMAFLLPPRAQAGEIIGGQKAKPHSRPYMAYLEIRHGNRRSHCGGFLVAENFVLTAAHCNGEDITVLLGAHNIRQDEETQQRVSVQHKIPHPGYNKTSREKDLMLLQLVEPAELTDAVDTIPLPQAGQAVEPGSMCSVAGWGRTSLKKKTNILHEVELEVMSDETCQNLRCYRPVMMMCVGDPNQDKASFSGDSGGPLVCDRTAQGIVSFGKKNGSPPRVFTRVSAYVPWIERTMRGLRSPGPHVERLGPLH